MSTTNLQGIGSILGSECQISKAPASLRRTLSADMSSKKWLTEQGFSPLKKIASSEHLQTVSELDIWNSVQSDKEKLDQSATPYVHPLTKRSRSLSQKSLEICTESLGSETGSDGFSSYSPSEASDGEQDQEEHEQMAEMAEMEDKEDKEMDHNKFVSFSNKKVSPRSFPPPLPSLSLHMRSHRQDGRLVLEAVPLPVPSQNHFHAQREGGRLLLTFINSPPEEQAEEEETLDNDNKTDELVINGEVEGEEFEEDDNYGDEEDENEEEDEDGDNEQEVEKIEKKEEIERGIVMKVNETKTKLPTGVINMHRSALMVNKLMGFTNRDPTSTWSPKLQNKFDTINNESPHSLPPPPRIARMMPAAASFNNYEYCWRNKKPSPTQNSFLAKNISPQMKGNKEEYLVPLSKGCKDPRRSLLIWEPYCIAT